MRNLCLGFFCIAWSCVSGSGFADDGTGAENRPARIQNSVTSAIEWLQDRGESWKDSRQCASCHHVTLMTWAMHEAGSRGVPIDKELLKTAQEWHFAEGDPAKLNQGMSGEVEEYTNPLSLATVYAVQAESNDPQEAVYRPHVKRMLQGIVDAQEADGSWKPFFGRKPIFGSRESLTVWVTNVTSWPNQPEELRTMAAASREKAIQWLRANQSDPEIPVLAQRLWMETVAGSSADVKGALVQKLISTQRDDGGWSQTDARGSDAYATAQVLVAFQIAGVSANHESVIRGQDFLLKTQSKDGSWVMISREGPPILTHAVSAVTLKPVVIHIEPPSAAGARNVEPISFVATAWATVALAKTLPIAAAEPQPTSPAGGK